MTVIDVIELRDWEELYRVIKFLAVVVTGYVGLPSFCTNTKTPVILQEELCFLICFNEPDFAASLYLSSLIHQFYSSKVTQVFTPFTLIHFVLKRVSQAHNPQPHRATNHLPDVCEKQPTVRHPGHGSCLNESGANPLPVKRDF